METLLYKYVFPLVVVAAMCGFFFVWGMSYKEKEYQALAIQQASENAQKMAKIVAETESKTRQHYQRYIYALKSVHKLPDKCQLSADFVRMRNKAAGVSSHSK